MNDSLLYEPDLQEALLSHSVEQYGIKNTPMLLRYLFRRYFIVELEKANVPKVKKEDFPSAFMTFWLNDLAIPINEGAFVYKGITFTSFVGYGSPLGNIYDDLLHQLSNYRILSSDESNDLVEWEEARKDVSEWLRQSKRKGSKYARKFIYPYYLKSTLLAKISEIYQANVQLPRNIEDFKYQHLTIKLNEEEICSRYLLAFHEEVTDGELLSEDELERYVMSNLEDVEPGLRLIQSQYTLPNGRIDILARDKEGNYVVIELKVGKDTDVVWQKWYYTKEIKKRFNTNNVRFIAILPRFHKEIIEPLLEDQTPTTILQFHPTIQRGKLRKARFTPYKAL